MNKKYIWLVLLIGIAPFTPSVYAETLHEAVQYTLQTNPQVRAIQYNRLARTKEVEQAKAGYFPKVVFLQELAEMKFLDRPNLKEQVILGR